MSWETRDYARRTAPAGGFGGGRRPSFTARFAGRPIVFWLIVINITVFVVDAILARAWGYFAVTDLAGRIIIDPTGKPFLQEPMEHFGHFSAATAILGLQLWRFITFQFLHADLGHLFFNMLSLFFFGPMIESHLGSRRFIGFYLLCGIAGPIVYLLFWAMGYLTSSAITPLVGASAGIFGVLIAGAVIAPNATIMLLFPPIPMRLRTFALILVGVGAYTVLFGGKNAGGEAAHLGGAALGFYLIRNPGLLRLFGGTGRASYAKTQPGTGWLERLKQTRAEHRRRKQQGEEAEIDRILIKVRDQGLASLTPEEKKQLRNATDRKHHAG